MQATVQLNKLTKRESVMIDIHKRNVRQATYAVTICPHRHATWHRCRWYSSDHHRPHNMCHKYSCQSSCSSPSPLSISITNSRSFDSHASFIL